jgi:hypothetical protein
LLYQRDTDKGDKIMIESDAQRLSTVQSALSPMPVTITAAATIAPTTFLTILSGNTAVETITPPIAGAHMLAIMAGTTTGFTTGGNVSGATTTVASRVYLFVYNPVTGYYYVVSSTTS